MKYELTSETKVVFGRTLYRIRALVSFGSVLKGEAGGFVEKTENLSQSGNAWVYGNAEVCGDAQVYGDARVSPIVIAGLRYPVTITDQHMKIGCEFHPIGEWGGFDDRRILEMDGKAALTFWRSYKNILMGICQESGRIKSDISENA